MPKRHFAVVFSGLCGKIYLKGSNDMKYDLYAEAKAYSEELSRVRRSLHRSAGVGFDIENTVDIVRNELEKLNIHAESCGKAGLVAVIGGKKPGKTFLLRADMDALPIKEESGESFAAENGNMHACGHDMHTAMLIGAAKLLKAHEDDIDGTVKLMFQPAEEIFEGASDMIANGVLKDPTPDAAMMIHVMAGMPFSSGTVIVSAPDVSAPAADYFTIRVQGVGCHGSMPNAGIDPLNAAAHIVIALQELSARELAVSDRAVLTIGTFHAGTASNVIPDTAELGGTLRTFDEDVRAYLKKRISEISCAVATAFRAKAEVSFGSGCPTLYNDPTLAEEMPEYIRELLGREMTFTVPELQKLGGSSSKSAGSEDFAYISQEVPSIMLAMAAGHPENGYRYPQHHPMARFDEAALPVGAAVHAHTAMRWLNEHK